MESIVNVSLVLILLFLLLIITIFLTSACRNCSAKEATQICMDFLKDILSTLFENSTPPVKKYYPVIIGWNGHNIQSSTVDNQFKDICNEFNTCFCTNAIFNDDIIKYTFDIYRKANAPADVDFIPLLQKKTEQILFRHLQMNECFMIQESLVHIELDSTHLFIYFARTDIGITMLNERKQKYHWCMKQQTMVNTKALKEKWGK